MINKKENQQLEEFYNELQATQNSYYDEEYEQSIS